MREPLRDLARGPGAPSPDLAGTRTTVPPPGPRRRAAGRGRPRRAARPGRARRWRRRRTGSRRPRRCRRGRGTRPRAGGGRRPRQAAHPAAARRRPRRPRARGRRRTLDHVDLGQECRDLGDHGAHGGAAAGVAGAVGADDEGGGHEVTVPRRPTSWADSAPGPVVAHTGSSRKPSAATEPDDDDGRWAHALSLGHARRGADRRPGDPLPVRRPRSTMATGRSGSTPASTAAAQISPSAETAMRRTTVEPEVRAARVARSAPTCPDSDVHRGRHSPLGDRDAGERRDGEGRRDARDDRDLDPGPAAGVDLLATAAEDIGVAALEPHDAQAPAGAVDEDAR